MLTTLDDLRRFVVAHNFFPSTTLKHAVHKMGFVQADPIRAPARAQDLILRHRVTNYRAGDLERRYATLEIDEDVFINYGFVTRELQALMHPREKHQRWKLSTEQGAGKGKGDRTRLLLDFVRERGEVHPRDVDDHFSHGSVTNYWGGSSNATTRLLEDLHYRGLLRVTRREKGIRLYIAHQHESVEIDAAERRARIDALVDTVVRIYSPLAGPSLSYYVRRLRYAVPHWRELLTSALQRAKERLPHARIDGVDWYWLEDDSVVARRAYKSMDDKVRLLAPFDPVVHDRGRFELLWEWAYRFEAYTPVSKRKRGYYALPLLWRDRVIGWANLSIKDGRLESEVGFVGSRPRDVTFKRELDAELMRMRSFLRLDQQRPGTNYEAGS